MRRSRSSLLVTPLALSLSLGRAVAAPGKDAVTPAPSSDGDPARPASASPTPKPAKPAKPRAEAGLSMEASLVRATAFYEAGQYGQCADAFAALLDDASQASALAPRAREQASVYRAACLIALSRTDEADDAFREAIRENPQMAVPNVIVFPPAVIERFIIVRTTLMEEIRRSEEERAHRAREAATAARHKAEQEKVRVQRLEALASQETVVAKNERWVAWVPFGVGQFQNRDFGMGAAFLASEIVLVGTAIGATSIELSLNSQAKGGAGLQGDVRQLNQNIHTANDVALIASGGFLLVAGLGILQANLAFVPEFGEGTRPRRPLAQPLQTHLEIVGGSVTPTPGGASFGVMGRF